MKKKNVIYSIDSLSCLHYEDKMSVTCHGWALDMQKDQQELELLVNGEAHNEAITICARPDVQKRWPRQAKDANVGFSIDLTIEEAITSLVLRFNGQTIADFTKKDLEKHQPKANIVMTIDLVEQENGTTTVKGWAFSKDGSSVSLTVVDAEERVIGSNVERTFRPDLINSGLTTPDTPAPGFIITFASEKNQKYDLRLQNRLITTQVHIQKQSSMGRTPFKERIKELKDIYSQQGLANTLQYAKYRLQHKSKENIQYLQWANNHCPSRQELESQRRKVFAYQPKISIVTAAWNTRPDLLIDLVQSLQAQSYPHWELVLADASDTSIVKDTLEKHFAGETRIHRIPLEKNSGISANTNEALKEAAGDYIAFADHDDTLSPDALYQIVSAVQETPWDFLYSDEDKFEMESKDPCDPYFKPDFSLDLLRSNNYICHLTVVSRNLFEKVGFLNPELDGAQDYDFNLRCIEQANGICHIPRVLYHWRKVPGSTAAQAENKTYTVEAGKKALENHLARQGIKGTVIPQKPPLQNTFHIQYEVQGNPLVSVVIPNKDHKADLKKCIDSILEKSTWQNLEFIIIENNSTEPETFAYYDQLKQDDRFQIITYEGPFNFSSIMNHGIQYAKGDDLLILNNDTEVIEPDSIREMLSLVQQPGMGVVGARLIYPNHCLQHAGIIIGRDDYATHCYIGRPETMISMNTRLEVVSNFSAVTGACMMVSKKTFEQAGGFDEQFAVACNDIDFCLKVRDLGYRIACTPFSYWIHYESLSRGSDMTAENFKRFQEEVAKFNKKWPISISGEDPFHNPNFDVKTNAFHINPEHPKP